MLHNDVLLALQRHDAAMAQSGLKKLAHEYPQHPSLANMQALIEASDALAKESAPALVDLTALALARQALQNEVVPAANKLMGISEAVVWLRPFWQALVQRAAHLPFRSDSEADHVVPMLLHLQDWQGAQLAITRIESWRRIPAPLAWMTQARLNLLGLQANWGLLAELAWLSPKRLAVLVQTTTDLQRLIEQFEFEFEMDDSTDAGGTDDDARLAWFPAWVLTAQPQYVADLALAQVSQHTAPEQAMRLLVNLLGLERQGRQREIIGYRQSLLDLNAWLYRAYLRTR